MTEEKPDAEFVQLVSLSQNLILNALAGAPLPRSETGYSALRLRVLEVCFAAVITWIRTRFNGRIPVVLAQQMLEIVERACLAEADRGDAR